MKSCSKNYLNEFEFVVELCKIRDRQAKADEGRETYSVSDDCKLIKFI